MRQPLKGWIGVNNRREVVGWIFDPGRPDEKLLIEVELCDWHSEPRRADELREHLRKRRIGDGRYGFTVPIPAQIDVDAADHVSVHPADAPESRISGEIARADWRFEEAIAGSRALRTKLSTQAKWDKLAEAGCDITRSGHFEELLRDAAKANIRCREYDTARKLLTACDALFPGSEETAMQLGVALSRAGRTKDGLDLLRPLFSAEPSVRVGSELAQALVRAIQRGGHGTDSELQAELSDVVERCLALGEGRHVLPASIGNALARFGERELGLRTIENYIKGRPDMPHGHVAKARFLLEQSRVDEALTLSAEILERWPDNAAAAFNLRVFDKMRSSMPLAETLRLACLTRGSGGLRLQPSGTGEPSREIVRLEALAEADCDWFAVAAEGAVLNVAGWLERARRAPRVGCIRLSEAVVLWRREAVACLLESDLLTDPDGVLAQLAGFEPVFCAISDAAPRPPGAALVISRYGAAKFGGAEHTLAALAQHYRECGFTPKLVGTHPDIVGEAGVEKGLAFENLPDDPAVLRRHVIENGVTLVHAISGLGYSIAQALSYTNIPLVYGVHFWREALGHLTGETYFDDRGKPIPRSEFAFIVSQATSVYANSQYTQRVIEEAHGVRCPIIYSVPEDRQAAVTEPDTLPEGKFVLLVNARPDKGFDLFLKVAALCPQLPFVAIASQSPVANACEAVRAAALDNVTILEKTDDMAALYDRARVVVVPSYRFIETFSRTCIEAHRYGKPVIGSTVGNVPNLLAQSGVVLPEDAGAWAAEIARLFDSESYYAERSRLALENSGRYSQDGQRRAIRRIVGFVRAPILIGIGSGIGNMLHAGPMIRNIARRLGHPVDVVVSEDHANSLFLLHNSEYVNATFALRPAILQKPYSTIFLAHSFGGARVAFAGDRVIWSRDWRSFTPGWSEHETIFNLEAAQALLGIPYDPEDIPKHFISELDYSWTDGPLVGIHGGSKEGYWASKRWGGFPRLAGVLSERGFRTASFGTPDEYVPGTEDRTGGTIEDMARAMRACSYFVSNDSGGMNVANALGIPVLGLFGPTDRGTRKPLSPRSATVAVVKDCAPCEVKDQARFKLGDCRCIDEISVQEVLAAFEALRARVRREEGLQDDRVIRAGE